MDVTDEAILLVSRTTMRFVEANAAASQMLGYSREELLLLGPMDLTTTPTNICRACTTRSSRAGAEPIRSSLPTKGWFHLPAEVHRHAQREGEDWIIVEVTRDITERVETERRLQHMAHFDALTGLLNRTLFHETLTKTLMHALDTGKTVAVLFMDLDSFKNVNDPMACGRRRALIQVSDRIIKCVRVRDTVGRLGGMSSR